MQIEEKEFVKELSLYSVRCVLEYKTENDNVSTSTGRHYVAVPSEHALGVADLSLKATMKNTVMRDENGDVIGDVVKILRISEIKFIGSVSVEKDSLKEAVEAGKEHHES